MWGLQEPVWPEGSRTLSPGWQRRGGSRKLAPSTPLHEPECAEPPLKLAPRPAVPGAWPLPRLPLRHPLLVLGRQLPSPPHGATCCLPSTSGRGLSPLPFLGSCKSQAHRYFYLRCLFFVETRGNRTAENTSRGFINLFSTRKEFLAGSG